MFRRIKTLWKLSGIEIEKEKKTYLNSPLTVDGLKERIGVKRYARIIDMAEPTEIFPLKNENL